MTDHQRFDSPAQPVWKDESLWGENNFIVTWFVTFCFQTRFKEIIIMKPWNTIKEIFQMVLKKKLQRWVNSSVAALIGLTFTIPLSERPRLWQGVYNVCISQQPAGISSIFNKGTQCAHTFDE